ncbi:hypothetical protein MNBD_GAMMA13-1148, partial [hydrothermal vent metagenome]
MSRPEIVDVKALKRTVLILLTVAAISAALWWSSDQYKQTRVATIQQARSDLNTTRDKYHLALKANDILKTSQQRYRHLQQRGFVGDEPRLLWIESLRATGREHHLYNLQYSLQQQQAVQLHGQENIEYYQLYASTMKLELNLAHEIDLLRYLDDLERRRPAVYQLRSCSLKPLFADNGIDLDKANISASCDLLWYTLKNLASVE